MSEKALEETFPIKKCRERKTEYDCEEEVRDAIFKADLTEEEAERYRRCFWHEERNRCFPYRIRGPLETRRDERAPHFTPEEREEILKIAKEAKERRE